MPSTCERKEMDAPPRRRGATIMVATAVLAATLTTGAAPAATASPATPHVAAAEPMIFLDYYEGDHTTKETRALSKALRRLDGPLRAPIRPQTVGKVSAVGYASFGFDCGVLVTHTKSVAANKYGIDIWTWGRLDTPARNALDYPVTAKSDPRHVHVHMTRQSAMAMNTLLKKSFKACS